MRNENVLTDEQKETLAMEVISFCKKWGMWHHVQIFTGGKCYSDSHDTGGNESNDVKIREEKNPGKYMKGLYRGMYFEEMNPENIFHMTFEGPLCSFFLDDGRPAVQKNELSPEVIKTIKESDDYFDDLRREIHDEISKCFFTYDPMEFDSYEEYLEASDYNVPEIVDKTFYREREFASKEDYQYFLDTEMCSLEQRLYDAYFQRVFIEYTDTYEISGTVHYQALDEFDEIFRRYGLIMIPKYKWSMSAYWMSEVYYIRGY